jgi:hypothetical protein
MTMCWGHNFNLPWTAWIVHTARYIFSSCTAFFCSFHASERKICAPVSLSTHYQHVTVLKKCLHLAKKFRNRWQLSYFRLKQARVVLNPVPGTKPKDPWTEGPRFDELNFTISSNTFLSTPGRLSNNSFAMCRAVVKSYFWIHYLHFNFETSHFDCHQSQPICADDNTVLPLQFISRRYSSATRNISSTVARSGIPCRISCLWLYLHRYIECWR